MVILENIDIGIDIDKAVLQNIDIDKISNRFKFGISNRARLRRQLIHMVLRSRVCLSADEYSEQLSPSSPASSIHTQIDRLC